MYKITNKPDLSIEKQYPQMVIAGVDEAGRGPLAGPVVAAAVIIDPNNIIPNINDSKKLSPAKREKLYQEITDNYQYSFAVISPRIIDEINILEATKMACIKATQKLQLIPEIVLVDGNMKFMDSRFVSIIKGDSLSLSIAAASIVAKVTRDRIMQELDKEFPEYKWAKNAGYGTKEHIEAIRAYGQNQHHRKSFKI